MMLTGLHLITQNRKSYYPRKYNGGATVFSNNYYSKPPVIERTSIELYSDVTDRLRNQA